MAIQYADVGSGDASAGPSGQCGGSNTTGSSRSESGGVSTTGCSAGLSGLCRGRSTSSRAQTILFTTGSDVEDGSSDEDSYVDDTAIANESVATDELCCRCVI